MEHAVLLATGGLDSTTMAYWLLSNGVEVTPVYVDYGQHCVDIELRKLREVLPTALTDKLHILSIAGVYDGSSSRLIVEPNLWEEHVEAIDLFLPYRNMLILTAGAAYARTIGANRLYAAFINSNNAKEIDCSIKFFSMMSEMLSGYDCLELMVPFAELTKREVALIGLSVNAPIAHTFSCQVSSRIPCGACPNCVDRLEAIECFD